MEWLEGQCREASRQHSPQGKTWEVAVAASSATVLGSQRRRPLSVTSDSRLDKSQVGSYVTVSIKWLSQSRSALLQSTEIHHLSTPAYSSVHHLNADGHLLYNHHPSREIVSNGPAHLPQNRHSMSSITAPTTLASYNIPADVPLTGSEEDSDDRLR
jgi:hypothetical protein